MSIIHEIRTKFGNKLQRINESAFVNKAVQTYVQIGRSLSGRSTNANQLMGEDAGKLRNSISPVHIGKLMLFFYDPKHKETLPYYDRAPLIMPVSLDSDGFIGINFHYLHPLLRAQLLDMIMQDSDYNFLKNPEKAKYDAFARRQLNMTYDKLQGLVQSELFKPCVKKYLWSHCRSRFYLIDPQDWVTLLPLPLERFEKQTAANVWRESLEKVYK